MSQDFIPFTVSVPLFWDFDFEIQKSGYFTSPSRRSTLFSFCFVVVDWQRARPPSKRKREETTSTIVIMSREGEGAIVIDGFKGIVSNNDAVDDDATHGLRWYCAPDAWKTTTPGEEGYGGEWNLVISDTNEHHLELYPPAKKDFWLKTYYRPILIKDDGPVLYATLSEATVHTVTTHFTLFAQHQFDQAGIVIRLDYKHWIKTGIEVVDGKARLSCVVTNGYSDWSTQPWQQEKMTTSSSSSGDDKTSTTRVDCTIRVHCRTEGNFVVEARRNNNNNNNQATEDWELVRICHLSRAHDCQPDPLAQHTAFQGPEPPTGTLWAGVFGCCPIAQSGETKAVFKQFFVSKGSEFDHTAD